MRLRFAVDKTAATHVCAPQSERLHAVLDAAADAVASTLPAGSSAGGEQPKFLAVLPGVGHVIVKFTPPLHTPGGMRWLDLLYAEHLANATLGQYGFSVATTHVERSARRGYLVSERFDRIGANGRLHVVSIGKAHEAFVQGTYRNWSESSAALASRGCLAPQEATAVGVIRDFGRLIGNTDMHGGNLGLYVDLAGIRRGRFVLAPVYDMLPMRWKPDALQGGVQDYAAFTPEPSALASPAAPMARMFWERLSACAGVSGALKAVAAEMAGRMRG